MAYVRFHGGTVASNNLADIKTYCRKHSIEFISTDDILCLGVIRETISWSDATALWERMKNYKQALPPYDFNEAYTRFVNDYPKSGKMPTTG